MIVLSLCLVLIVAGSCAGVMILFFKRLQRIEAELWGDKRKEAQRTAAASQQTQNIDEEANPA